ncbi:MAG: hypothetical protein AABY32_04880 [Nanoarchaeota archaeon]
MAKLTAWLVTLVGLLLVLANLITLPAWVMMWAVPLAVLVIGLGKLMRNYKIGGK